jgi:NAD(P)-dependent dehydrogenase (short-subunit alcohol dehydrogenase family)
VTTTTPSQGVLAKFSLEGKVALVTGVGPAMGRDFALALAEAGADVCVSARSRAVIDEVAGEVSSLGRRSLAVTCDVSDSAQVDELVAATVSELGRLDVMCNHAAGRDPRLPIEELSDAHWHEVLDATLSSVFYGTRAAARVMIEQGTGGSIVNTSSICSVGQVPGHMIVYSTAKAAVNHFTRYMASELAEHGIRVNAILPGTFGVARVPQEVQDWLDATIPLRRRGRSDEVAPALLYLASGASSYVTGETLLVSGGAMAAG